MFKKIKEHWHMRKLERQMKFELLSRLYFFVEEKDQYMKFFRTLAAEIDYNAFQKDLAAKIAEFAHDEAVKQRDLERGM